MRASDLIKHLEDIIEDHGDLKLVGLGFDSDDGDYSVTNFGFEVRNLVEEENSFGFETGEWRNEHPYKTEKTKEVFCMDV